MPERLTATASVATDVPQRYAKQLASHLGRRAEVQEHEDGTRILFTGGYCVLHPRPGVLELRASGDNADALERVKDVVARHLERFGQRNELRVVWAEPADA